MSPLHSRRFFLQLMMFGGGAAALAACGGSSSSSVAPLGEPGFPQGVFAGDPTAQGAVLSTRVIPAGAVDSVSVTLQIADNPDFASIVQQIPLSARRTAGSNYRNEPGDYIARVVVQGLPPAQTFYYRFVSADGFTSPVGQFRTLPEAGDGRAIRFMHISCANEPPFPIGAAMLAEVGRGDIDFISFNGDTVYADRFWLGLDPTGNLDFYRSLYRDQRDPNYAGPEFPQLFGRTSFVINWDDHEVIDNYSGQKDRGGPAVQLDDTTGQTRDVEDLKVLGYQAFFEYNPITPSLTDVGGVNARDRVFRSFRYGANAEVFIPDLRQYRDLAVVTPILPILPPGLTRQQFLALSGISLTPEQEALFFGPPGSEEALFNLLRRTPRTLLGGPQKQWLLNGLRNSTATYKFIVSQFPITVTYFRSNDVWEGYWLERQEVLDFIEANNIRNVVFLTGNNHAGFIGQVNPGSDNPIWEVWAGPTGRSVTALSIDELGNQLGIPNASRIYYGIVNGFLAPVNPSNPQISGIPGVTTSNLRFLELAVPNYHTIEVSGSQCTIQIKGPTGSVLTDPFGRRGELILPQ
ncbi:alkaline phosphatase D family protein [Synechococcus sp. Nb3U1]|uniref:alkaline phosphatase D family protein n=1 Tax=Synechococcus sp. Nb3U1 TaxID=1914529 RepID=UPI001F1AA794|nr:alkaline phosphatase D family protein [Synechococcus sp. Nb3U1]MCF2970139.1 alkaline phosphatase D family protein [Synechococcus sp. Nb3U1]